MKVQTYFIIASLCAVHNVAMADPPGMERCYGIAKAGMNDCVPNAATCDKSVIDSDPNYWLYVPKGTCNRIVGGMTLLTPNLHPGAGITNLPAPRGVDTTVPPITPVNLPATVPTPSPPSTTPAP